MDVRERPVVGGSSAGSSFDDAIVAPVTTRKALRVSFGRFQPWRKERFEYGAKALESAREVRNPNEGKYPSSIRHLDTRERTVKGRK